jgi:hypothetical protein
MKQCQNQPNACALAENKNRTEVNGKQPMIQPQNQTNACALAENKNRTQVNTIFHPTHKSIISQDSNTIFKII